MINSRTICIVSNAGCYFIQTREELKDALDGEIRAFLRDTELGIGLDVAWNYIELEVNYPSLSEEVQVGDYYLRVLLEQGTNISPILGS